MNILTAYFFQCTRTSVKPRNRNLIIYVSCAAEFVTT